MSSKSDAQLLREYAQTGTDSAFAEIVARHTDLIYSAALRQVTAPDLARDVTQNVFTVLARKAPAVAGDLPEHASVIGWLYRATRFEALNLRREELRRQAREREAMEQLIPGSEPTPDWQRLRPLLDEVMADLNETDRDALLLRYFKNQDFQTVGLALGVSDDAAQKRVTRAVEKLRESLARRGLVTAAGTLAVVVSTHAVQAAPVGLTLAITTATAGLCGTALTVATTKVIVMTTLQKTLIATAVVAVGAGLYEFRENVQLRRQVEALTQRLATGTAKNEPAPPSETPANPEPASTQAASKPRKSPTDWAAQMQTLNSGDWRAAFGLGQQLAALPPETGFTILQTHWNGVTNVDARQQLLKAFTFARHERLPAVLELGVLDATPAVQGWALSYLKEVALQDFSADYNGAVNWLASKRELKLSSAFADALWNTSHTLPDADSDTAFKKLTLLRDARQLLAAFPQVVAASGLGQTFAGLVNSSDPKLATQALYVARNMAFGDEWLRNVALPRLSAENSASVQEAAANALAAPGREWALSPMLEALEKNVRAGQRSFSLPQSLAEIGSPKAIPTMIALIETENTYDTVYGIGYFGLGKLTGVTYDEKHDGAWWRQWWEDNKQRFPADVQAMEIPRLEPVRRPAAQ